MDLWDFRNKPLISVELRISWGFTALQVPSNPEIWWNLQKRLQLMLKINFFPYNMWQCLYSGNNPNEEHVDEIMWLVTMISNQDCSDYGVWQLLIKKNHTNNLGLFHCKKWCMFIFHLCKIYLCKVLSIIHWAASPHSQSTILVSF